MKEANRPPGPSALLTIFLAGDVMTGRGVDQVLPHPGNPRLHESYVKDARDYVRLAEETNGPFPRPVDYSYIWGDALAEWQRLPPDAKVINLETSITVSDRYWPAKGIHYKMHPANIPILNTAGIGCCTLANNHVMDWGEAGLMETLETLEAARIKTAGAGSTLREAQSPAVLEIQGKRRVLVFSLGSTTSGIPLAWAARPKRPGINVLADLSPKTVHQLEEQVRTVRKPGDIVIASIHWGGNWGYRIPAEHVDFAHLLIDRAGIDVVHGHSSHHVLGLEVYHGKPVIYGCGDFLNDYEGIGGYEEFRADLSLMYFSRLDAATGTLAELYMRPTRVRRFQVQFATEAEARFLRDLLNREGRQFGTRAKLHQDGSLHLQWD